MMLRALRALLDEIANGPGEQGYVLNPGDQGLFRSLERLPADAASTAPPNGGPSVAGHVDHLRYGFSLLNRWQAGEEPFADADYSASWARGRVNESEWRELLAGLKRELDAWRQAFEQPRATDEKALTAMASSVVHLAYHLGAIRQAQRNLRGPSASGV